MGERRRACALTAPSPRATVQASENEILSIIDRTLFDLGWDVWSLIFDGLMAAPSVGTLGDMARLGQDLSGRFHVAPLDMREAYNSTLHM